MFVITVVLWQLRSADEPRGQSGGVPVIAVLEMPKINKEYATLDRTIFLPRSTAMFVFLLIRARSPYMSRGNRAYNILVSRYVDTGHIVSIT